MKYLDQRSVETRTSFNVFLSSFQKLFSILLLTLLFLPANAQGSCGTPDNLQALVSGSEVSFSWTGTNDADIHVILLRNEQTGQNANAYSPTDASYTANNIPNGQYTWRVISICNTANTLDDHSEWVWGGVFTISDACTPLPSTAHAGSDQLDFSGISTTLAASSPSEGTGVWSIQSGSGGSIGNANSTTSTFTGVEGTSYILRWTVSNACGSSYDEVAVIFAPTSVTDIDGNIYSIVQIGTQLWMAENLKVSKYNDGTTIPNVTDNTEWSNLTTGAWSYNNNDPSNNTTYGKLYNWYAVDTDKLCPTGWHMPSDAEWTVLTDYLGGYSVAGGKMKSVSDWNSPNNGATNESEFSGLPGGYRNNVGTFNNVGIYGFWWSSTESSTSNAWSRFLNYSQYDVGRSYVSKKNGSSCRCLRD